MEPGVMEPGHIEFIHRSWPADPTQLAVIRHELASWLAPLRLTDEETADVVLAVDEAVANVVDHAYRGRPDGGTVNVYAWTTADSDGRRVTVSVTDQGRWRPVPVDPGRRGRGLLMMSTCMASLHIEHSAGGTSVTMTSNALPDPDPVA